MRERGFVLVGAPPSVGGITECGALYDRAFRLGDEWSLLYHRGAAEFVLSKLNDTIMRRVGKWGVEARRAFRAASYNDLSGRGEFGALTVWRPRVGGRCVSFSAAKWQAEMERSAS